MRDKNIVVFGCSFSKFKTPTYADILSLTNNVDNRADIGIGNERIFYNVLDAYKKNHFQNIDIIIVQWSHPIRWDYLGPKNEWISSKGRIYQKKIWPKLQDFWNEEYEREKSKNYMISVNHVLSKVSAKKIYITYEDSDLDFIDIKDMRNRYVGDYKFYVDGELKQDHHPTVYQQFEVAKQICRICTLQLHEDIDKKLAAVDQEIRSQKEYKQYYLL